MKILRNTLLVIPVFILVTSISGFTQNSDSLYTILTIKGQQPGRPVISVLQDTLVEMVIESKINIPDSVIFHLSPFYNKDNVTKHFKLVKQNGLCEDSILMINKHFIRFNVNVGRLEVNDFFSGYLFISKDTEKIASLPLSVRRIPNYRPAFIKLNQDEIKISTKKKCASISFIVFEDSLDAPIYDLRATIVEDETNYPLDLKEDVIVTDNKNDTIDLLNTAYVSKPINIDEGQYYLITINFKNLKIGKRTLKLDFTAANASINPPPTLTFQITRKARVIWAILTIFTAIIFTLITKKLVAIRSARIAIRKRARNINNLLSDQIPYNMAKIRVKRILKMALEISKKSFSKFDECEHDLSTAEEITAFLQRTTEIYTSIDKMPDGMQKRRIMKNYNTLLVELARMHFDEGNKSEMDEKIIQLKSWFEGNNFSDKYNEDLNKDIDYFFKIFDVDQFDHKKYPKINELIKTAKNVNADKREAAYAVLKICWENRKNKQVFLDIYHAYLRREDVEDAFHEVDNYNWQRLKQANESGTIKFISPRNSGDPFETFQGMNFEIAPLDPEIGNNYLFKHGIRYDWAISIKENKVPWWKIWKAFKIIGLMPLKKIRLKTTSCEPIIRQFSPITGTLSSSVSAYYRGECFKLYLGEANEDKSTDEKENADNEKEKQALQCTEQKANVKSKDTRLDEDIQIVKSTSTQIVSSANRNDVISFAAAMIIGILTGITSYYLNQEVFGTAEDYILLFLWGGGIEQGTSFLTYLKQE